MSQFLKVAEAVTQCGLSRAQIYRLINNGTIPSTQDGKVTRVDIVALRAHAGPSGEGRRKGRRPSPIAGRGLAAGPGGANGKALDVRAPTRSARAPISHGEPISSEIAFLKHEVERLWRELESRRLEQQAERDRLLKIIETLAQR